MSVMHCPLCVGLAVLSVTRAVAHLTMGGVLWSFPDLLAARRGDSAQSSSWM